MARFPNPTGAPLAEFEGVQFSAVRLHPHPTVLSQWREVATARERLSGEAR